MCFPILMCFLHFVRNWFLKRKKNLGGKKHFVATNFGKLAGSKCLIKYPVFVTKTDTPCDIIENHDRTGIPPFISCVNLLVGWMQWWFQFFFSCIYIYNFYESECGYVYVKMIAKSLNIIVYKTSFGVLSMSNFVCN